MITEKQKKGRRQSVIFTARVVQALFFTYREQVKDRKGKREKKDHSQKNQPRCQKKKKDTPYDVSPDGDGV